MGEAGTETVDKFIEHELAVHESFAVVADFFYQSGQKFGLNLAQGLCRPTAFLGKFRIGLPPLFQFCAPLACGGR